MSRVRFKGAGVVTAFGVGREKLWEGLINGKCAIRPDSRIEGCEKIPQITAHIPEEIFTLPAFMGLGTGDNANPLLFIIGLSLQEAFSKSAGRDHTSRIAGSPIFLSTLKGDIRRLEDFLHKKSDNPYPGYELFLSDVGGRLAAGLGSTSSVRTVSSACVSGALALVLAAEQVRFRRSRMSVVAAGDLVCFFVQSGFSSLGALSQQPCRPFDASRDGLSLGEGSAGVLLTGEDDGTGPFLLGWGITNDASHLTGPSRTGEGLRRAIRICLSDAGIPPEEIGAIVAHGTGTRYNDSMEALALKATFPKGVPPICGIKGAIGHTLGAAGLIECVLALDILEKQVIPPTVGTTMPEHEDLHFWGGRLRSPIILKTCSGFGGINVAVLIGYPDE